jgi:hypothetical protein
MKLIILFLFFAFSTTAYSLNRPDIDTVSILGLTPGLDGKLVGSYVSAKFDTLLWNETSGIGIIKFSGSYLGSKGEFRIAYDKGFVSQVSFVAPTRNQEETNKIYTQLSGALSSAYGPADIETTNEVHEMRWEGLKQSIYVKAVDGSEYVTVALSKF